MAAHHHCPVCGKMNNKQCIKKGHFEFCEVHGTAKNPRWKCPQCDAEEQRQNERERERRESGKDKEETAGKPEKKKKGPKKGKKFGRFSYT